MECSPYRIDTNGNAQLTVDGRGLPPGPDAVLSSWRCFAKVDRGTREGADHCEAVDGPIDISLYVSPPSIWVGIQQGKLYYI